MSNSICGLLSGTQKHSVPLKKADIQVSIHGFIANVKSDLHYVNDTDENMETEFVFPLDTDSAVYKFEAEIDKRTIVAEIQEKSQAKQTYQDAVDSGYTAMYMGEDDNAGDIFRMQLGNLPAKTAAKLTFAYTRELDLSSDNTGTFMLPIVLNPRYAPKCTEESKSEDSLDTTKTLTSQSDIGMTYYPDFTMNVEIVVAGGKNLMESGNKMEIDVLADIIEKKITSSRKLEHGSDFSMVLRYKGFEKPKAVIEEGIKDSENGFMSSDVLMVNFSPEFKDLDTDMPCEFVFIVDRSGSMMGTRIEKAKEALLLLLKSLPLNCKFNVVSFGSSFSTLFPTSVVYNEENLEKALNLQKSMDADMGGTEILEPLQNVFKHEPSGSYARQVFLLTDGGVWNVTVIVDLVKKQKNTRVFTFGIGDGCSTELIREVAKASKGKATFVKDTDRLQSKVMSVMKNSVQCGITDATLTWKLPKGCSVINAPEKVPPVFQGEALILYGIISGDVSKNSLGKGSMKLTGNAGSKRVEYSMEFVLSRSKTNIAEETCPLHRLAAKSRLSEMEMNDSQEGAMVALSTAANVTCKHSAFVGVDQRTRETLPQYHVPKPIRVQTRRRRTRDSAHCSLVPQRKKKMDRGSGGYVVLPKKKKMSTPRGSRGGLGFIRGFGDEIEKKEEDDFGTMESTSNMQSGSSSRMKELIEKQKFDGSWKFDNKLSQILKKSPHLMETSSVVTDKDVWATALAIAFLGKEFPDRKDEWEMLVEKALKWLKTRDTGGKDVVQEAMAFLST
ncbi:von Willebrand factor A domain-containing protein 5A-like isoform X3 [Ostrea edulis]|uniref:von Willebrand factor A domain-containing protein 5A-like isoform X3 n=1 Tax=Ostrea edulis TaxID=37623 RepID=UPI002094E643|nr:von Willebrand factor A domain-containing protein 5A-like isoform X3 [Ostrea edulis]